MPSFLCGSSATTATARPRRRRLRPRRILLLGIGGAGKSTLFRQIHGPPVSYKELESLKITIHNVVIAAIKALVDGAIRLSRSHPSLKTAIALDGALERSVRFVTEELEYDRELLPKAARHISRLWSDAAIQRTFQLRHHFDVHVPDSAPFFFDRLSTISALGYVPNSSDYLHCTVKSSGIAELVTDDDLQILDLGGRRMERRKWARCFDAVAGIIFVASIGDFLEPLEEDLSVHRLTESVAVFEEIVNNRLCFGLPVVVAFSKVDLLPNALKRGQIQDLFPEYTGGADPQNAISFFKALFLSKVRRPAGAAAHVTFQTCNGLDRASALAVFRHMREVLLKAELSATTHRNRLQ